MPHLPSLVSLIGCDFGSQALGARNNALRLFITHRLILNNGHYYAGVIITFRMPARLQSFMTIEMMPLHSLRYACRRHDAALTGKIALIDIIDLRDEAVFYYIFLLVSKYQFTHILAAIQRKICFVVIMSSLRSIYDSFSLYTWLLIILFQLYACMIFRH